ncbi:vWA domain-containing protein [Qipengyuania xiamenensis]|uniref:vWA domain-containing protein n=1 Tax=Qipengyuania xiamenensis TaxID=2867237 RepID=UPI001FFC711C|nr:VWA domain-containing protein [Qipengyuania xiamenensis]
MERKNMDNRTRAGGAALSLLATSSLIIAVAGCSQDQSSEEVESIATYDIASPPPPVSPAPPGVAAEMATVDMAMAPPPPGQWARASVPGDAYPMPPEDRERYAGEEVSSIKLVSTEPVSTFSVDVDTGAYANARRFLTMGQLPPRGAVRTEEMINYFRYDYARPEDRSKPFSVTLDAAESPWNPQAKLIRVGLRGYDLPRDERPAANLVFLVDVSGSMNSPDKLPLVKRALSGLASEMSGKDKVSIVVYAGRTAVVLEPTSNSAKVRAALSRLEAGGSTAGAAGLELAYDMARQGFIKGGVNRVILATDGDFNVGMSDTDRLIEMIEKQRDSGVTLTTLGFGTGNYNEAMMEQIANHGNGNYAYIDSALEAKKVLREEMSSTLFTIAKDVKIQVEFNPSVVSQYRLIGYENRALREEDFNNDAVDAGDIGAGHQVTAIYEIIPAGNKGWISDRRYGAEAGSPAASRSDEAAFVQLRYKLPDGSKSKLIQYRLPAAALQTRRQPQGDFAFAAAVAAYGQKLRGDDLLKGFSWEDVVSLAGRQRDYYRQEFVELARTAEAQM